MYMHMCTWKVHTHTHIYNVRAACHPTHIPSQTSNSQTATTPPVKHPLVRQKKDFICETAI